MRALRLCQKYAVISGLLLAANEPALWVQERLLDDDGQMWMSFKERLMYWERQLQLAEASDT